MSVSPADGNVSPRLAAGAASTRTEAEARAAITPPLSMDQVINLGATRKPKSASCSFCGSDPDLPTLIFGRFYVTCSNEDCHGTEQTEGETPEEAAAKWNRRAP